MDNISMANARHLEIIYTLYPMSYQWAHERTLAISIGNFEFNAFNQTFALLAESQLRSHTLAHNLMSYRNYSSLALVSSPSLSFDVVVGFRFFFFLLSFEYHLSLCPPHLLSYINIYNISFALLVSLQLYHLNSNAYLVLSSFQFY